MQFKDVQIGQWFHFGCETERYKKLGERQIVSQSGDIAVPLKLTQKVRLAQEWEVKQDEEREGLYNVYQHGRYVGCIRDNPALFKGTSLETKMQWISVIHRDSVWHWTPGQALRRVMLAAKEREWKQ